MLVNRALKHDPEKWTPVFGKGSCFRNKIERDDDSQKRRLALGIALAAVFIVPSGRARAETLLERSAETRMQIDFAVSDAAIKKVLPAGWETDVATSGGAKDCNLRMIFIDRFDVTAPDGAPKGSGQLVILEVPVKNPGSGLAGRMIVDGTSRRRRRTRRARLASTIRPRGTEWSARP